MTALIIYHKIGNMKEIDFLNTIQKTLSTSHYLGNDCAYVEPENLYITQDTLVEDVHFKRNTTSAYMLGKKTVSVNVSDLCAALAAPTWMTISLSLPNDISNQFVEDFYLGVNYACQQYGIEVIGGDITGSDKIMISACAIARKIGNTAIGRNLARKDDVIAIAGFSGSSAVGLYELSTLTEAYGPYVEAHLSPAAQLAASINLREVMPLRVCSMDTSDGLADAVFKVAKSSNMRIVINGDKVPVLPDFKEKCQNYGLNPEELIMYGGEDFALFATMHKSTFESLDSKLWTQIGTVEDYTPEGYGEIIFGKNTYTINEDTFNKNSFDHFKGEN